MDWDAEHILLRTVRCVSGTVELVMNCEPSFDYHRIPATWEYSASVRRGDCPGTSRNPDAHPTLRLTTNLRLGLEGHEARARTDRGRQRVRRAELVQASGSADLRRAADKM
jgi:GH15 family glucan-1,4-alpha-glucosidase